MSRDELDLMQELRRLSERIPGFVLEFANHDLSVDVELAFVHQLANMAEGLLRHANGRRELTTNGEPTPLVIDMPYVRVEEAPGRRELPGSAPGDDGTSELVLW